MQTSYQWLKELVAFDLEPDALAERLTLVGTAVQSAEPLATLDWHFTVAEVRSAEPHPSADRLTVCKVRTGGGDVTVVCGAPNVRAGQRVVHVAPGGRLPGGDVIGETEIRGVRSFGMLCSETELGLFGDSERIVELPEDCEVGRLASEVYGDTVLSFELTPNRPDCLSAFGLAREIAAATGGSFHLPPLERSDEGPALGDSVDVRLDFPDGCPRYSLAKIEGLKVGPSPFWLRQRILASGMRPINNIVDITNFVMMETGQPLHAFDFDRLKRPMIVVRASRAGETFTTLDEKTHNLPEGVVLITDGEETVALGGVMGGLNSEVGPGTKTVLLESAYFDPRRTRRTRKALGIDSEAALRFEKGTDPNMVPYALDRAAHLLAKWAGGTVRAGVKDAYPVPRVPRNLALRPARVRQILGVEIPPEDITGYLQGLSLQVTPREDALHVRVPTFRPDLEREIDLIEEVARLYGHERIPVSERSGGRLFDLPDHDAALEIGAHRTLAASGYSEAVTNSMGVAADFAQFAPQVEPVKIANPISEELAYLRSTLLADLSRTAVHNFNRRNLDWKIYTMGTVFCTRRNDPVPEESLRLGLAHAGLARPRHWRDTPRATDWYELKGAIEDLFAQLRLPAASFISTELPGFARGSALAVQAGGAEVGRAGLLSAEAARHWDIKEPLWLAELNFDSMRPLRRPEPVYTPLPRYPAVTRDLALVVSEGVDADHLLDTIRATGGELLTGVELFDLYRGKPLPEGSKSLAYSLEFRSASRSLQTEEVDSITESIVLALAREHKATLRT